MKAQEYIERQLVMTRLLNLFSAMDGGLDYIKLREFAENAEGETITQVFKHMNTILNIAKVSKVSEDSLPERMLKHALTLED